MDNMTYPYVHLLHVLNLTKEVNTQILHSYVLISNLSYFRFRTARATVVIGLHYWEDWSFVALTAQGGLINTLEVSMGKSRSTNHSYNCALVPICKMSFMQLTTHTYSTTANPPGWDYAVTVSVKTFHK